MARRSREDAEPKNPHTIKQGWDVNVTTSKGKKITGIVRNIVCQKNGDWKFDLHRKSDNAFLLTLEWKE
jgi:hypothetical protein